MEPIKSKRTFRAKKEYVHWRRWDMYDRSFEIRIDEKRGSTRPSCPFPLLLKGEESRRKVFGLVFLFDLVKYVRLKPIMSPITFPKTIMSGFLHLC